jgi:hypothetical protein
MKRFVLAVLLSIALAGLAVGQKAESRGNASAGSNASASKQGRQIDLQSGTQLSAQLENTLDARHAKPGDRVVMKTTQAVKQDGRVIVPKGAQLIGHVTEVQQRSKSNAESSIGVVVDRLRTGSTETPITASILSITQARSQAQASNNDLLGSDTMAQSSSSSRSGTSSPSSGQRGGGLLGGVGSTVGGVVNTTTSTVGNVAGTTVGATTSATGSTTGNLTGSLRGLQITQSGDASAQGGSTLSLTGRDLRLESGTTFNLAVSNSASVRNNP